MSKKKIKTTKEDAIAELWLRGILSWKLDSCQKNLYRLYKNTKVRKVVWNCSRRLGKSFSLIIIALEQALQVPGSQIKYACPTARMAEKIILPTLLEILKDCPAELKPKYVKSEKSYYFNNNSVIQIEGTDEGNAEKLRGTSAHLAIFDEAAIMDDLEYIYKAIILPQFLTTNGRLIAASTPPLTVDHYFVTMVKESQLQSGYIKKTIYDAIEDIKNDPPHLKNRLSMDIVEEFKAEMGGEESTKWRREFLCELVTDVEFAVIPEFSDKIEKDIVQDWPRAPRFDAYTVMDIGYIDFTGVLFGYYDFKNAKIVIEDELLIKMNEDQNTSKKLAEMIKAKEAELWAHPQTKEVQPVYLRFADNDLIVLNDLHRLHNMIFIPTSKDNLEPAVNEVRIKVLNKDIIINPRCKNLIFQLKSATWTKSRKGFARSSSAGHYDLVAALIYFVRNVQFHKNPYANDPQTFNFNSFGTTLKEGNSTYEAFKKLFKVNK